jgi:hypothetical protein
MRAEKTAQNAAAAIVVARARHVAQARRVNVGKEIALARTNAAAGRLVPPRGATRAAIGLDRTVPAPDGISLASVEDAARVNTNGGNHLRHCPKSASCCFLTTRASSRSRARSE